MNYEETEYIRYLKNSKNISHNTQMAYERDLKAMCTYLERRGIKGWQEVSIVTLNSYVLYLESTGFSEATVSRNVAVIRGFFRYLHRQKITEEDVGAGLAGPNVQKREPRRASTEEVKEIFSVLRGDTPKLLRDRAMIEVFYSSGIMIEELVGLCLEDVNMDMGYVKCAQTAYPVSGRALLALQMYLERGREKLLKGQRTDILFPNIRGYRMSRQGFWKMIQQYSGKAGIKGKLTPSMLRHS